LNSAADIKLGKKTSEKKETPLYCAQMANKYEMVNLLRKYGASDEPTERSESPDKNFSDSMSGEKSFNY